ncbi:MAG: hypothetical protein NWF00_09140 [Candidatus Bathyarchaeota archaeon]|nr:hypothetical protein [Candidatus Bathyarchaeota archaeon]
MSSEFPRRPTPLKGYLLTVNADANTSDNGSLFIFQYNPHKLVRTLTFLTADGAINQAASPQGTPTEIINLTLELDATDKLEQPEKNFATVQNGLHPALATLESMMYPMGADTVKAASKVILFAWGTKRVLPVRLLSLKVSEEAFDVNLNPIRANVDVCMRVLQLSELKTGSVGYNAYRNHFSLKDVLALLYKQSIGKSVSNQISNQTPKATSNSVTGVTANENAASGTVTGAAGASGVGASKSVVTKKSVTATKLKRNSTKRSVSFSTRKKH